MLKPSEKAIVAEKLGGLFRTYLSSRSIEPEAVVYFVEDVAEFSLQAIVDTINAFRKDQIPDRNAAFAPSVGEFVGAVRKRQERIDHDTFWDRTDFVVADSPEWKALERLRGKSMPRIDRNGVAGWYVAKEDVRDIPIGMLAEERKIAGELNPEHQAQMRARINQIRLVGPEEKQQ